MDCAALIKACSHYENVNATLLKYRQITYGIEFTITSMGCDWKYTVTSTEISTRYLGGESERSQEKPIYPANIRSTLLLACCWIMIRECWPSLYDSCVHTSLQLKHYTFEFLRTLTAVTEYDTSYITMYLAIFAILNEKQKPTTCKLDVVRRSDIPHVLYLYYDDCVCIGFDKETSRDVNVRLWLHLCDKFRQYNDIDVDE
jgi:hypothetical protein